MQDRIGGWTLRGKPWGWAGLIFGLVLACYWPARHGDLVWDDAAHITSPELRSWAGLGRIWIEPGATQQYYPVLHSVFWAEHRLWGDATLGYHLANLFFHALSCVLLARSLRRLSDPEPGGLRGAGGALPAGAEWLAATIFAVHPVGVESVAWIAEQKNALSLVFYLLAALAYLRFHRARDRWTYGLASTFFLLALGTKTVTATLPAALLVALWWRHGCLSWKRDVGPLLPWFLVGATAGLFTAWVERMLIGAEGASFDLTAVQRLLLAGRVVWFYLGKLFWPVELMFVYPRWDVAAAASGWYGWLTGGVALTIGLWRMRRRTRGPLAAWLFFVGSLFPALGFFNVYPFVFSYVADHFQYLPSLGIIAAASGGVATLLARASRQVRRGGWVLCGLLIAGLGLLANRQSRRYADGETLYRTTLAQNPACWMAHNNLGIILAKSPATAAEAIRHYQEALRYKPDYGDAHTNLAAALSKLPGREAEAIAHGEEALRIHFDDAEAHGNLANVLATLPGREAEALAHAVAAVRLRPDDAAMHYSLANALARWPHRIGEALAEYERALRLNPDYVEAHVNLANELARLPGRLPEAFAHYERALQIEPKLPEVHYNVAVILANLPGRETEAMAEYREALRLQPNYAKAHNNLAVIYARHGRWAEAREHWETALKLNPDYADARRNLNLLKQREGR